MSNLRFIREHHHPAIVQLNETTNEQDYYHDAPGAER